MDSTETARRLPGNDAAPRSYAELTSGYAGHPPIYAALVAEWEARGHTVPEHRDGQWVSFAAPAESETWTAVTSWAAGRHMGPVVPGGGPRPAPSPHSPAASHPAVTPHPAAGRHPGQVGAAGTRPGPGRPPAATVPPSGARLTSRPTPPAPR
ncbi:hypothetical protein [Streptomyces massasporeus]|uniref:hypothetical protein n=1 Tax=Streptomyces massasporeus TaxID=67324 RepID=UPI0019A1DD37|nr:hypothetical protein [Streptomyces massasporeus]GGV71656.1 hypothetical protein GCM10010228_29870 [Streptomyces massasporeus]